LGLYSILINIQDIKFDICLLNGNCDDVTEVLLNVELNTINLNLLMEPWNFSHRMVLNLPEILDIPSAAFSAINWVFCVLSDSMTSFKAFSRCRNLSFSVCNIVFSSIMSFTVSTPSASIVRFPYKYQNYRHYNNYMYFKIQHSSSCQIN
jgi:hypothetical protein